MVNLDPRVARTRDAVIATTIAMMTEDGPEAITHQRVAEQAGVARATLYRHWPQPEDLVFEALATIVTTWEFDGPGRLGDELVAEINRWRPELNQPAVRMAFTTVISRALRDPAAAALRDQLIRGIADGLRASIEAGTQRGELKPGLDAEILTAQVMGAMVWRSFVNGEAVTRDFVERIVRAALDGWEL
jgi:AcrR family transcriptional regulator